ncbi:glycerophosphodiester phosphodiesterase [Flaviramulus sp. BrNp1-15]|uniref:glycerophosphodiester phosphodiesterase family protein n=1 Tax=Flaviramulus sp. BrNp1-15 TaxID=2916754 RepID=UPI001EE90CD2|nr:glycerophosphodiester phosphodiesterase family protein [Flaviramulus sp. BrNp1-15]ULC58987.1 glycerophosphodiester phosphodiesterase [Flaviramulus sp. BrNp1-15]
MKRFTILISALILMNCNKTEVDIQGHRGCRGLLPENSLPAFKKAIELGVNTLEMDLAISRDHKVVVSHEPFISRTYCLDLNGEAISKEDDLKYNLYQMDYDSIKLFDCGSKFHKRFPNQEKIKIYKPLLSEVFSLSDEINPEIKYNIEIKAKPEYDNIYTPTPKEFVSLVLNEIEKYEVFERTNLQSFDIRILEEIKRQAPKMKVALLIDENELIDIKLKELSFKPEIISPYYKLLTKAKVKSYQNENYKVIPWTVNKIKDIHLMLDFKVDGIITDYPDKLISVIPEKAGIH